MEGFNQMHPVVSVIVPIYRSEEYLERCCRSLFEQTLTDVEFLMMLDGPSEVAEAIINRLLRDYPQRREGVKIIRHEQNQGISHCRQEGHELAQGDYLFHCDSDDWMERDALAVLYSHALQEEADLVFADYVRHYQQSGVEVLYSPAQVLQGNINTMDGTLCNKLIKKTLITEHQLRFPAGINWGEDMCMSVLLQRVAKKIAYLPRIIYHYCMHASSLTTSLARDKYQQLVACPLFVEQELKKRGLENPDPRLIMQMKFEVKEYYLIQRKLRDIKTWKMTYPECHAYIWQLNNIPVYLRLTATCASHSLAVLAWMILQLRDGYVWLRNSFIR